MPSIRGMTRVGFFRTWRVRIGTVRHANRALLGRDATNAPEVPQPSDVWVRTRQGVGLPRVAPSITRVRRDPVMTTSPGDNPKGSGGGPAWTGEFRTPAAREAAAYARAGGSRALRAEGEGLHRLLVESVRDYAIFALDPAGYILSWNLGAERLKGYTVDEILGKHFSIFYPPEDIARGKPPWELEVAAREGRLEDEGWRLRKDGTRFWANVIITALRNEDGELVGFAKVTRDLTERRASEEVLRQSEARFRQILESV